MLTDSDMQTAPLLSSITSNVPHRTLLYPLEQIGLNVKKAELKDVEDRLASLNAKLAEMQAKQTQLAFDVDLCEKKLDRATKVWLWLE